MEEKRNETGKSKGLRIFIIFVFAAFTVFAMVASLIFGSADISFSTIMHTLLGNVETTDEMVIWNIRFPRNIVGALVGANLAVSGAILQAVMKNPLADPGIVGVSSGAGLAGVIMLIFMPEASLLLTPVAFVGAMLSAAAVYALAWKNGIRPSRIILAGVAVSAFLGSGISALLVFTPIKCRVPSCGWWADFPPEAGPRWKLSFLTPSLASCWPWQAARH